MMHTDQPTPLNPNAPAKSIKWLRWCLLAATGIGAGLLNGLLGAAGGILLVFVLPRLIPPSPLYPPAVALGRHHDRRDILATALAVMLPVSAVSGIFYWVGGIRPAWELLIALSIPAILGGVIGAKLLGRIPVDLLQKLFAALVVFSGIRMLF